MWIYVSMTLIQNWLVFPCKSWIPNNPWGVNCKITYQSSLCDTFLIYLTTALASWHTDYKSGNDYSFVLSKKLPVPAFFLYETLSSLWFGMHSKSFTRYKSILFLPANWHWKKTHITDGNQRCNYVSVCVWIRVAAFPFCFSCCNFLWVGRNKR